MTYRSEIESSPKSLRRRMDLRSCVIVLATLGCSTSVSTVGGEGEREISARPLTSAVYVDVTEAERLRAAGATLLDTRDAEAFAAGHIPGALHAEWSVFQDASREGEFTEDDPVLVEQAARSLGIRHDRAIVVYGAGRGTSSSRLAWSLEYYGHSDVHILDGGFDAWVAESGASASTEVATPEPGDFVVEWRPELLATQEDVESALDAGNAIFFDARSLDEYAGTDTRDNPRRGHIPGAIHFEWTRVFDESGRLRPENELRTELTDLGLIGEGKLVIPYCQGGFRSSVIYSVLRWLGEPEVANYDGSWWEYSRNSDLPAEITPGS